MAGQAHFPFWPARPTENDTATLTAYKKISTFLTLLCDQVWQYYRCVQNQSNLLSLNATYRLLFSEMILMQNHGRQRSKCSLVIKLPIFCVLTLIFVRSLVTMFSSGQLHPLPDHTSSLSDFPNLITHGHDGSSMKLIW